MIEVLHLQPQGCGVLLITHTVSQIAGAGDYKILRNHPCPMICLRLRRFYGLLQMLGQAAGDIICCLPPKHRQLIAAYNIRAPFPLRLVL